MSSENKTKVIIFPAHMAYNAVVLLSNLPVKDNTIFWHGWGCGYLLYRWLVVFFSAPKAV